MQQDMKAFEEQVEAFRQAGDLTGLTRIKARLTDPEMIAVVEKAIADAPTIVIGLA